MITISKIIYMLTDEAPALATCSLLPIIRAFAQSLRVAVETRDISLAGHILANFPEHLQSDQRLLDHLAELDQLVVTPEANIIKLPNISASLPQLKTAIKELQTQDYAVLDYVDKPNTDAQKEPKPVMTNSKVARSTRFCAKTTLIDRRAPLSVKNYAHKQSHRVGEWLHRLNPTLPICQRAISMATRNHR